MSSTTNFASMATETLAAHSMRMFEVLFWDVCKSNEWSVMNKDGSEVDALSLTKAMLNSMNHGPVGKLTGTGMKKAYAESRVDAPAKINAPEPQQVNAPVPVAAAPVVAVPTGPVTKIDPKKIKKMEFKGTKIEMPYLPSLVDYSKCCQGIKICGGLMAPCLTHVKGGGFCKPCQKLQDEGKADGTRPEREATPLGEFTSKKSGKKEISFATYLQKRDITVEEFNTYLATEIGVNFQIPNEPAYMDVDKKKVKKTTKAGTCVQSVDSKITDEVYDKDSGITTFKFAGKCFARDEENTVFALNENQNPVAVAGTWDPTRYTIMFVQPPSEKPVAEPAEEAELVVSPMVDDIDSKITDEVHDEDAGITTFKFEGKCFARDDENTVFAIDENLNPVAIAGSWDLINDTIMFKDGYEA